MNKVVDGVELLRKIANNEFKSGQKIRDEKIQTEFIYTIDSDENEMTFLEIDEDGRICHPLQAYYTIPELAITKFEILSEENEEIDIWSGYNRDDAQNIAKNTQKINELIKAIKQLDKKLNRRIKE